jgi:hypothetical protein
VFSPNLHLRTETDPVSETSCFLIQDDEKSPEKFCEFCTTNTIVRILLSLPERFLVLISVRGCVDPRDIVGLEGFGRKRGVA